MHLYIPPQFTNSSTLKAKATCAEIALEIGYTIQATQIFADFDYAKTPSLSLPGALAFDRDRLGFLLLSPRDLLFDLLLLLRLRSPRDCRYFRCSNARRRRRFVNRIPVNITNEASNSKPPVAYFNFVTHVLPTKLRLITEWLTE